MKEFRFLTKNRNPYRDMDIINISPIMYNTETFEPVRSVVTYRNINGELENIIIGTEHPLWNEIPTNR
jgi:hypothetical protein